MRIVAGTHRGRRLEGPGGAGGLRPTSDRVRESLFGVLEGGALGDPLPGAIVLDLFAGTGALGFEALSRGAAHVTFVERDRAAQGLVARNAAALGMEDACRLIRRDATRLGPNDAAPATLVFLDPPYGRGLGERALAAARAGGWLARAALVVWEEDAPQEPPDGFSRIDARRYGGTHVTFLRAG